MTDNSLGRGKYWEPKEMLPGAPKVYESPPGRPRNTQADIVSRDQLTLIEG